MALASYFYRHKHSIGDVVNRFTAFYFLENFLILVFDRRAKIKFLKFPLREEFKHMTIGKAGKHVRCCNTEVYYFVSAMNSI